MATRQKRLYERVKDARDRGVLTKEVRLELKYMADVLMYRQWKIDLDKPELPGRRVATAILPHLEEWVRRTHGSMSYYLTLLSGRTCIELGRSRTTCARTVKLKKMMRTIL